MNMQNLMKQAQKMQKDLQVAQKELEETNYEGSSSLVKVTINGNKDVKSIKIDCEESLEKEDIELLEDMIVAAFSEAAKKADKDKDNKLGKYGQGLSGLF